MLRRVMMAGGGGGIYAYNPKVVYDILETTTLFQDSAGTTPVTGDGDPVGLMLNKVTGYAAADMLQPTNALRPIYRTSGGKAWLENDGTKWMESRSNGALAFSTVNVFAGARKVTGIADFDVLMAQPYAATHVNPYFVWAIAGMQSGTNRLRVVSNVTGIVVLTDSALNTGLDFIITTGINSMWHSGVSAQKAVTYLVNKVLRTGGAPVDTNTYSNSVKSKLFANASNGEIWNGNFYGAALFDVPVTSQAWIDAGEAWVNARLQDPV